MAVVRMTMAEALVRFLTMQQNEHGEPLFAGVWAIFGHGNVAGLGPALHAARRKLPTLRAHNEQAMAHAAIAFAKANARRRMMACTTSIGPGATNLVTAAALAHVNRLPVLFLPGDVFASRRPDPVLQQLEAFGDPTLSVNDCLRPVSRYFDRITRAEQILVSLPAALRVLLDPADCGPVTLALPQDVQTEAFDCPAEFFRRRVHRIRKPVPDAAELQTAIEVIRKAKKPLIIAGGGVKYALAEKRLAAFAEQHGVPVAETQAGKGSLPWDHACNVGAIGVTGSEAANRLAAAADVVLAIGTRLGDFATGSRALFAQAKLIQLNVAAFDAAKHAALSFLADADAGLEALARELGAWRAPRTWTEQAARLSRAWNREVERITAPGRGKPTDAQVLGAANQVFSKGIVVCAAGGLPGELHKLWRASDSVGYHLEYGYSCMGYEIAGGLGVKLAHPSREVCVLVGDGSYLMLNSEIATSIALGAKLVIVVLDNRGFGCIERLQAATGGASFNNLLDAAAPRVDFAAHARSLGAAAEKVESLAELPKALERARGARKTAVVVIETEPRRGTAEGGAWWDVAVAEVPKTTAQKKARKAYETARRKQALGA